MDMGQALRTAIRNLLANRVRCLQAMLAMVVGVAGLFMVLNIYKPFISCFEAVYDSYDQDTLIFSVITNPNNPQKVTAEDMRRLADDNPDIIKAVSPHIDAFWPLTLAGYAGETSESYCVYGVGDNYLDVVNSLALAEGRFFQPLEVEREQKVCLIGEQVNENVFNGEGLGAAIRLYGEDYKVIGVFYRNASDYNKCVMIPYTNLKRLQGNLTTYRVEETGVFYVDNYWIKANGIENMTNARLAAIDMIEQHLGELNRTWYSVSSSFIFLHEYQVASYQQTFSMFMVGALVVLAVGGVGVMNVMIAAVRERTPEIGLRKAFGATNRDIKRQFMTEALIISLFAGIFGIALGIIGSYIFCYAISIPIIDRIPINFLNIPVMPVATALAVCVGIGIIFGTYPAQQAAKMEIVDAINEN